MPETEVTESSNDGDATNEKEGRRLGCLVAFALLVALPVGLFQKCWNEASERADKREQARYAPENMILARIDPGEEFEINRNVFAEDTSNYEDAMDYCMTQNTSQECQAALEDVVGGPVDLSALHAAEEEVSSDSTESESTSGDEPKFGASVGDFAALDSDTVVAEVRIRNRGDEAGKASCVATIDNTTGNSGHDIFSTRSIKPGSVFRSRVQLATEDGTARLTTGIDLNCS